MSDLSDYLENALLDHFLSGAGAGSSYTPPTDVWIALFTTATSDAGGGTEVTGGSYARLQIDGTTRAFTAASAGSVQNNEDWAFVQATASWGTITHLAVMDAVSAGNMLVHAALTASVTIGNNDTFQIDAGDLTITLA